VTGVVGLAHTALCVADVDAAVEWYRDVLGLTVLSPPYRMEGDQISADMGELVPPPVVVKAAIMGAPDAGDHVLEIIEYPNVTPRPTGAPDVTRPGFTHVGLVCDDLDATRAALEAAGTRFLTTDIAEVAGLRTTWCTDPWDNVLILLEKRAEPNSPYWQQY
jgi:catechol 2,3-dioxygenase-like lactoylglutathione lyase family enzyme